MWCSNLIVYPTAIKNRNRTMNFPKANSFDIETVRAKIMGPNPLKICEEMLHGVHIPAGSVVCDLGSGMGITSAMLAREYGLNTYAVDLWTNAEENRAFFRSLGLSDETIHPIHADATRSLPFEPEFFDAVVSVDSYHYYGRDPEYLGAKLLPYVKRGGTLHLAFPGMMTDCHSNLPECLLASWSADDMDYMHDIPWWHALLSQTPGIEIVDARALECTPEAWADWLACDNPYAKGDRAAIEAGALEYLNIIAFTLRKL